MLALRRRFAADRSKGAVLEHAILIWYEESIRRFSLIDIAFDRLPARGKGDARPKAIGDANAAGRSQPGCKLRGVAATPR
jgi:hypothetical protein